jgi:hypothetical protein
VIWIFRELLVQSYTHHPAIFPLLDWTIYPTAHLIDVRTVVEYAENNNLRGKASRLTVTQKMIIL